MSLGGQHGRQLSSCDNEAFVVPGKGNQICRETSREWRPRRAPTTNEELD